MPSEDERAPELLRADREQLDRAAELLGGDEPALVLVVCGKALIPAALGYLRERASTEIPEPVVLQGSEEALDALVGAMPEIAEAKVRSLALGGDAKEALRALNWHREKLLRGAPVVLWLDGVDGLTEMREAAPDAYSFRDMVVLVRGDGGRLPQVPRKESRNILEARRRLARARTALERAGAYDQLSDRLRVHDYLTEAETVARRGLDALPENKYTDENARIARANLWSNVAMIANERGSQSRQRQAVRQGLEQIEGLKTTRAQEVLVWLLASMPGSFGTHERAGAEQAFVIVGDARLSPRVRMQAARGVSDIALMAGDVARAHKLLSEIDVRWISPQDVSFLKLDQAYVMRGAGRMLEAESYFQQAVSAAKKEGFVFAPLVIAIAECWLEKGELHIAEQVVRESFVDSEPSHLVRLQTFGAALALEKGELFSASELIHACLRDAARFGLDSDHLNACSLLAEITIEGHDARQLDVDDLRVVAVDLEVAEDVSRSLIGNEPLPWYLIRLLGFRADILIRTPRCSETLDLARRALDLARTTCADLVPEYGRALADHLLRVGKADDALPVLAEVEPEAIDRGMLKELARIRAARVLARVLLNQRSSEIEAALTALREALESTGAPRIKAETLQQLAIRLPPSTTFPDPLALASETHALFVEMPMPAKEARALELAGDVLAARGKPAEAKRRYMMAQGILERRGLGLRLPLLKSKLEQLG
jgi:tetratricopeptide (TPR) repeat protein